MGLLRFSAAVVVGGLVAALHGGSAMAGSSDDPLFLGWPSFLAAVPGDATASTEHDCPTGSVRCVDNVVKEMARRWDRLGCDHDAVFALTYLRTTEEYRRAVEDPAFFADNAFVNHEDAVFADFYFEAHDDWEQGRISEVPPAWRIAFHAADGREVTGTGNMLLGMNAHIVRDLPFVLHAIGLTAADGSSRKPDHDKVNEVLNRVTGGPLMTELAARYDPTMDDGDVPGTSVDGTVLMQLVQEWREEAWRKAELLRDAPTLTRKLEVARWIEDDAAARALALRTAFAYGPLGGSARSARDAYCAAVS